jgi:leader peptidase (prepilin peptidase)/N-methyltransferase
MNPILIVIAGAAGAAFGYSADVLSRRWPAHEDGSIRARDWRTPLVTIAGAVAFAATLARFGSNPVQLAVVFAYVAALVVLFATDLDQRLLPNLITYPLVIFAILVFAAGASPFVSNVEELAWAFGAVLAIDAALFLLAIPFGGDAIGEGDLKLLVSVGLFGGALNVFYALVVGAFAAGIVVAVLVFIRRLTLKSYFPYGPFLIAGALWVILALPPA